MKKIFIKILSVLSSLTLLTSACSASDTKITSPIATMPEPTATMSTKIVVETLNLIKYNEETRISAGDEALLFGDYEKAQGIYKDAFAQDDNEKIRAASIYGLGLTYFKNGELALSLNTFQELISTYPDQLPAQRAYYLLGEIYKELARDDEALAAYKTYLTERQGILDAHVLEKIGDLEIKLGQPKDAIQSYQNAFLASDHNEEQGIAIKIASAYDQQGEDTTALSLYQNIYYNSDNSYTKAQMDLLMGRIYYDKGETDLAYSYYQDAVNNFPEAYDSYSALVFLINDGQQVNELQRGLINYNIGQYDLAIEAFDRYMTDPQADVPAGLYYKALSLRAIGLERASIYSSERFEANKSNGITFDQEAITLWNRILLEYPTSIYYVDATEDIAYTYYAYMNNPKKAAEVAISFVASVPNSTYASSILFSAGRYYEIAEMLIEAANTWTRLGNEYPSSAETFQGLFFAGMLYYRLNEFDKAQIVFNKALVLSLEPLESAGAHLWLGIVKRDAGNLEGAKDSWRAANASDPIGYYGLRAQELLDGKEVFASYNKINFEVEWEKEIDLAEIWLRENFSIPEEVDLNNPGELSLDERFVRGYEFWSLGLYEKGRYELESLLSEYQNDASKSFQLMQIMIQLGYYRSAIASSKSILRLSGLDEFHENVPMYFKLVIYGTYYQNWILTVAERYQVDPLLLFSLIRQESHFEGYLSSSAGARGLMQIMPETGTQIANEMNWPENFTTADLDIPYVSLILGTNYFARQLTAFGGDIYAALAAYNGGPGNALSWKETAGDNPDLFLGSVRFLETRTYIRSIAENFAQYLHLYGSE